jgi:Cyclic nucleotide-binding domain.
LITVQSINDKLLELPLFQGMSRNDLNEVIAHTRFGFLKYSRNKTVIHEGDQCTHLMFLLSGQLSVNSHADNNSYSVTEQMNAPGILQPERIFGLTQRYTHTFTTASQCHLIRLSKTETLRLSEQYEIFRLNLLNIISTQSQKLMRLPWRTPPRDIRHKIIRFFESHCLTPIGHKTFSIKMDTLASEIAESRLNVSHELNAMHAEGIIILTRGSITIPALELLLKG